MTDQSNSPMVDPHVSLETNVEADDEIQTGVPVNQYQEVKNNFGNSESIRRSGSCFCFTEELHHPVRSENPIESDHHRTGDLLVAAGTQEKIRKICGKNAQQIQNDCGVFQVIFPQKLGVLHHESLLDVSLVNSHQDIQNIDQVAGVV